MAATLLLLALAQDFAWTFDTGLDPGLEVHGGRVRVEGGEAVFDGSGCLAASPAFGASDAFTMHVRVRPAARGGLVRTPLASLVIHESGLLVALLAVEDSGGRMYREVPLSPIAFDAWHDIVLRWSAGTLELAVDGAALDRVEVPGRLKAIDDGPVLLGGWTMHDPAVPGFAPEAVAWLYHRWLKGRIDHVRLWKRALGDVEVAALLGRDVLARPEGTSGARRALAEWRAFHDASRAGDAEAVDRLGRSMRGFMARDPRRPAWHLTAPLDGILDPAGAFFHDGRWHVFSYRGMIGLLSGTPLVHYESADLVRWTDRPIAVWPDSDLDVQGIWLGNVFQDDAGDLRMLYTALGKRGKIGVLARSRDGLRTFGEKRAVLTELVHHDGHVWKEAGLWHTITTIQHWGRREEGLGDEIRLLTSPDLETWTDRGELFAVPKRPDGADAHQRRGFAEFPYLVPFGDRHALLVGTRPVRYWIGRFDRERGRFAPDDPEGRLLDRFNSFHCFNPSAVDARGRRVLMAMNAHVSGSADGIPWSGVHVLPRTLTRSGDRLLQEPVAEIETLRRDRTRLGRTAVSGTVRTGIRGDALEVIAEFEPGTATRFGLKLGTKVYVDVATGRFGAEGGVNFGAPYPELGHGPAHLEPGGTVRLRVFLDRSLIEVFVNGETGSAALTAPAGELSLFSEGGEAVLRSLDAWTLE